MILKLLLGGLIGAGIGVGVGYAGKCAGGSCPLTCNPMGGMLVGALMGSMLVSSVVSAPAREGVVMSEKLVEIRNTEEFEKAMAGGLPVLVDFYADWCAPCKALKPTVKALADEYDGKAVVLGVNVDRMGDLAEKYGVSSIPDVRIFKAGKEFERFIGVRAKSEYKKALDRAMK